MSHFDHNVLFSYFLICFISKSIVIAEYPAWQILGCLNILLDAWFLELLSESLGNPRANLTLGSPKKRPDQKFCQVGI